MHEPKTWSCICEARVMYNDTVQSARHVISAIEDMIAHMEQRPVQSHRKVAFGKLKPQTVYLYCLTKSQRAQITAKLHALRESLNILEAEIDDHVDDLEAEIRDEVERERDNG